MATVEPEDRLWTSKDRSKYKKVQKRSRHISPPIYLNSEDEASDTDDGLGYTLPNVPVYFSDGEESEESEPILSTALYDAVREARMGGIDESLEEGSPSPS